MIRLLTKICTVIFVLHSSNSFSNQPDINTFWVKLIDQNESPIVGAVVFYCLDDCVLARNADNKKQTITNGNGLAELKITGNSKLRLQGVKKSGYDIRLSMLPYTTIRLAGKESGITKLDWKSTSGGLHVSYAPEVEPYSISVNEPLFVLKGWKLGESACFERDRVYIENDGRAESNWSIRDAKYHFKVDQIEGALQQGDSTDFDFIVTINRSHYPWKGIINKFISKYQIEVNFKNGGMQPIKQNEYIHVAPDKGYDKQYSMNFTGIGSVTGVHNKRLFFKVNRRYGILDLEITPSRSLFIEYLLSKDSDKKELNIPSYSGDHGEEYDYFSCTGVPYKWTEIQKTPAGSCAKLGGLKCS